MKAILLLPLLLSTLHSLVVAKRVTGDFKLSGVDSEKVLTSFAVSPEFGARFSLQLEAADLYPTERFLKLRLFRDEAWNRQLKLMTCAEKVRHAAHHLPVTFEYVDNKWKLKEPLQDVILTKAQGQKYDPRKIMARKRRAENTQGDVQTIEDEQIDDAYVSKEERDLISKNVAYTAERPQYWYFTMDDCMLEQTNLDDRIPVVHFDLEITNALELITTLPKDSPPNFRQTHLSADELNLTRLHFWTLLISGGTALYLFLNAGYQTVSKKGSQATIHAAVLWVAFAAALDAGSSFCEIAHMKVYERNGIGSYFLDALAAHMEALCDSLLMLLLLSIGAGWTLPSDAIRFRPNENALQKAFTDLASPLRALMTCNSLAGMLGWGIIAVHAVLCQWGRTYNDDFESYHDLEHLPGKLLMFLRIGLGVLLLAVTWRTHLQAKVQQLQSFYYKLAILGFGWFQSLPFVTWMCNTFVPYYMRHPTVFMWSALLQSSSIVLFAWLVTSHSKSSAFAQYSHMTAGKANDTSSLDNGGPLLGGAGSSMSPSSTSYTNKSLFSFGKAKISID